MKKKGWIITSVIAVAVVAVAAFFGVRSSHYRDHFLPKTEVMGVTIGGKTVKAANQTLKAKLGNVNYQLTDQGKTVATVSGQELGLNRDYTALLNKLIKKQNPWGFTTVVLAKGEQSALASSADQTAIKAYATSEAQSLNANRTAPEDAKVTVENGDYVIQKEKAGNQIDATKLANEIASTIQANQTKVQVAKSYVKPKVVSSDSELKDAVTKLKAISKIKAVITITNHKETIPTATLQSWLSYQDGAVTVSESGVAKYVASLATKYNTYDKSRQFQSTKRGTVTVPAGIYGWSIRQSAETKALIELIKKGADFDRTVLYQGTGYHADGTDIGNTYIEVDKVNQHEWFYKNGQLVMESDVVTGKPATPTPSGVFDIWSKQRNATLVGEDYKTPVSYWMPIDNTGVGLHDASWQPTFGGDWYLKHGSHGCVNQPPAFIAKLWNVVSVGTPVVVF